MAVGSALLGGTARGVKISWFSFCFHGFINPPFVSRILFSSLLVFQTFQASWPPSLTHPSCHITWYLLCACSTLGLWLAGDTVPVSMNEEGAQALELGSPDQIHSSVRFWVKSCALGLCVGCYAHLACMRVLQIQTQGFMLAWPVHSLPIHLSTHGMVSPTFRMGLLYTVKPFRKCFQSHTQRCVSMVILNSVKSTLKIAHHRGCW